MLSLLCIMLDSLSQDNAFSGSANSCEIREVDDDVCDCVFTDWSLSPRTRAWHCLSSVNTDGS